MPHEPFWLDGVRCQPYGPNGRRVVIVGRGCLPKAEVLSVRVRVRAWGSHRKKRCSTLNLRAGSGCLSLVSVCFVTIHVRSLRSACRHAA